MTEQTDVSGNREEAGQTTCPIVASVQSDLASRAVAGLAKYGVTLARTDLGQREWLQHAYEEALDLACYLKRLMGDHLVSQSLGGEES